MGNTQLSTTEAESDLGEYDYVTSLPEKVKSMTIPVDGLKESF